MTTREIVVRSHLPSEHVIQLFDTPGTRAEAIADFLNEGYQKGDALLLAISQPNWARVAAHLRDAGVPVDAALASGDLTVHDARVTLEQFMRNGKPDRALFEDSIGGAVRRLAASGRQYRVYGEIVDLLAAEGDFASVQMLEDLWNDLCDQLEFPLFCGYSAANFGDPRSAESLRSICRSHSLVRANSRDLLGSFLATAAAGALKFAD
jgi:hypothetical protein